MMIVFEGIDGAGKKTLADIMENHFLANGFRTTLFTYPDYKSPWGHIIKQYLDNQIELSVEEQFFTYFTDIYKDQTKIKELISRGNLIIADRYFASTIAFQCGKGFNYDIARAIINTIEPVLPSTAFYVRTSTKKAVERCKVRRPLDRHERDAELLDNVTRFYDKIVKSKLLAKKWVVLDGDQNLEVLRISLEREATKIIKDIIE